MLQLVQQVFFLWFSSQNQAKKNPFHRHPDILTFFLLKQKIIKIDLQKMNIQYEDSITCLECWGHRSHPKNPSTLTQSYQKPSKFSSSQKTNKLSLKKQKITLKSQDSSINLISYEQTHQNRLSPELSPQVKSPQPFIIYSHISNEMKPKPTSNFLQKKEIKVTFNHNNSMPVNSIIVNIQAPNTPIEETQLDETTKITKPFQNNRSELQATKKCIPGSKFSLEELSHLKQSVISICQGDETKKIEESTVMMDYFNPTQSRLADYKLSRKFPHDTLVCSKRV